MRKFLHLQVLPAILTILGLFSPAPLNAQGVQSGGETTVSFTGTNVPFLPPNTPASNLISPGVNTFIFNVVNPTVGIRIYITNNTANPCSALTAQLWAASDPQVSSFNNSLSNWQIVPLQSATGGLAASLPLALPASGVTYFTSTAISAPRVALQIVNTAGNCLTTNLEITGVITAISVTSPLVSSNGSVFTPVSNQVQGLVQQQSTASSVDPIVTGGVQPPVNGGGLSQVGIDNFNISQTGISVGTAGVVTPGFMPSPINPGSEFAIAFEVNPSDSGTSTLLSPWNCVLTITSCNGGNAGTAAFSLSTLAPVFGGTAYRRNYQNAATQGPDIVSIVVSSSPNTLLRQAKSAAGGTSAAFTSNTAAGSTILVWVSCSTNTPCVINTPTDTQGNSFKVLDSLTGSGPVNPFTGVWAFTSTTQTTAAADTVSWTAASGTASSGAIAELSGVTPSQLNQPTLSNAIDTMGQQIVRIDAQAPNQFTCSVTISTATTTQCQGAPTTVNVFGSGGVPASVPVRAYVTDVQYNTTTAGSGSTLQVKTGTGVNCATGTANLSAITYSGAAVGLQNSIGFRTPLVAPLQNAVCVTQVGATPSTTTVEIHGFLAP